VGALFFRPPTETVAERFEHPVVRNALAMLLAAGGPISERSTASTFLFLAFIHRFGICRPAGGMGTLTDALIRRLASWGGTVRTSAPVGEVLMRDGRATGIALENGETVTARRAVVSAIDPKRLAADLLPAGAFPSRLSRRLSDAPANGAGMGTVKVDLALSDRVRPTFHEKWRADGLDLRTPTAVLGSVESLLQAQELTRSGRWSTDLPLWALPVSALDPSLAPSGQDVMYLWTGWAPLSPTQPGDEFRRAAADALIAQAATVYVGLAGAETARLAATSADYARDYRVTNGCIVHIDLVPSRSGPLRPARGLGGYRTPIAGLYLSGAGTHPGGGVSGLPGKLAAAEVLRAR
jgi:phytoene dehydrogenase-like protein